MNAVRMTAALVSTVALTALAGCGDDSPQDASVAFETPGDGASLAGSVQVAMTADGLTIEPAGEVRAGAGHFHVIADAGCAQPGTAIAKDADHVHFGNGATDGRIYLEPGSHSLCLQVGDGAHAALDATDTVAVEIGIENRDQWCDVVQEVDLMFDAVDASGDEFAVQQIGYENIRRLVAQLEDATDVVDPVALDGVEVLLDWTRLMAETLIDAESEEAAMTLLFESEDSPFAEDAEFDESGVTWIRDTCGVAVDE